MEFKTADKKSYFNLQRHENAKLSDLVEKSNFLSKLQSQLAPLLDKQLAKHCQVANLEEGKLTIIADTASWATKIRFKAPELLKQLKTKKNFLDLKKIRCIIRLNVESEPIKIKKKRLSLSKQNASLIRNMATTIKDQKLRNALEKLADK